LEINVAKKNQQTIYVYDITRGAGVPGLPHELTEAQASEQGVLEILVAAIANGSYTVKE
jgi:hypothetical protein